MSQSAAISAGWSGAHASAGDNHSPVLPAVTINPAAAAAAAATAKAHMDAAMRASADEEALSGPLPMEEELREGQAELAAKRPNRTRRGYCLEVKGRSAGKWFEGSVSSSNDP